MCKSKIFAKFLEVVSIETEVSCEEILSNSKEMDVVDARHLLIHVLHKKGLSTSSIASLLNKTTRCINQSLSSFESRLDGGKMLRINLERVKNKEGMD